MAPYRGTYNCFGAPITFGGYGGEWLHIRGPLPPRRHPGLHPLAGNNANEPPTFGRGDVCKQFGAGGGLPEKEQMFFLYEDDKKN